MIFFYLFSIHFFDYNLNFNLNFLKVNLPTIIIILFISRSILHPFLVYLINWISTKTCDFQREKSLLKILNINTWRIHKYSQGKFVDHYTRQYWILGNSILPNIIKLFSDLIFIFFFIIYVLTSNEVIIISLSILSILTISIIVILHNNLKFIGKSLDSINKVYINFISLLYRSHDGLKSSEAKNLINQKLKKLQSDIYSKMKISMTLTTLPKIYIETMIYSIFIFISFTDQSIYFSKNFEIELAVIILSSVRLLPIAVTFSNTFNLLSLHKNLMNEIVSFDREIQDLEKTELSKDLSSKFIYEYSANIYLKEIEINNLNISFIENFNFNQKLNFKFTDNNFIHILGPSGCGKSTLIKILCKNESRFSGKIFFKGFEKSDHKNIIDYVSQNQYKLELPLFENLTLSTPDKFSHDEIISICNLANKLLYDLKLDLFLDPKRIGSTDNISNTLSGGELQRLNLARGLLFPKPVICFDEVTNSLNQELAKRVVDVIEKYAPNSMKIFVNHNSSLVKDSHIRLNIN